MAYTGDYTRDDKTLVSVRGGYMKDNYFDTGVNKSQTFEYVTATASLPPALLATVPRSTPSLPATATCRACRSTTTTSRRATSLTSR